MNAFITGQANKPVDQEQQPKEIRTIWSALQRGLNDAASLLATCFIVSRRSHGITERLFGCALAGKAPGAPREVVALFVKHGTRAGEVAAGNTTGMDNSPASKEVHSAFRLGSGRNATQQRDWRFWNLVCLKCLGLDTMRRSFFPCIGRDGWARLHPYRNAGRMFGPNLTGCWQNTLLSKWCVARLLRSRRDEEAPESASGRASGARPSCGSLHAGERRSQRFWMCVVGTVLPVAARMVKNPGGCYPPDLSSGYAILVLCFIGFATMPWDDREPVLQCTGGQAASGTQRR